MSSIIYIILYILYCIYYIVYIYVDFIRDIRGIFNGIQAIILGRQLKYRMDNQLTW